MFSFCLVCCNNMNIAIDEHYIAYDASSCAIVRLFRNKDCINVLGVIRNSHIYGMGTHNIPSSTFKNHNNFAYMRTLQIYDIFMVSQSWSRYSCVIQFVIQNAYNLRRRLKLSCFCEFPIQQCRHKYLMWNTFSWFSRANLQKKSLFW